MAIEKGEHLVSSQPRHADPGTAALIDHLIDTPADNDGGKNNEPRPEGEVPEGYEEAQELPPAEQPPLLPDDESTPEAAQAEGEEFDEDPMVPVKVGGVEQEVPLSEVINGYSRNADYTRKTQQLAEERRQLEAQIAQAKAEHSAAAQRMNEMANQFEAQLLQNRPSQEAMDQLRVTNPAEYAARVADEQRQMQQLAAARQQVMQNQQAEMAQRVEQEKVQLAAAEPAFAEDFEGTYNSLGKWVTDPNGGGISVEEWNSEIDHRRILIAYRAMLAAEKNETAGAKASSLRAKVTALPRIRPGARKQPGEAEQQNYDAAMERMSATGTNRDIAKALMARRARNQARRGD